MEIYCLGNEHIEADSIGPYIAKNLKIEGVEFRRIYDINEFERICERNKELVLIDAANVDKIIILEDAKRLSNHPEYSLHDYDIGFSMRLMKKLGTLPKIRIIAIPSNMPKEKVIEELPRIIESISS